ncbi:hypothetical protein CYMTET_24570, partial [Cymbomonas tetramitiformis]
VVDRETAELLAYKLNAEYFEVSAKTAENVNALFERMALVLFERAVSRAAGIIANSDGSAHRGVGGSAVVFKPGSRSDVMGNTGVGSSCTQCT